jgi:tetratricopeptide (TPR) repeat protein
MKIIKLLLISISIISIYVHYLNKESAELQYILYEDIKKGIYEESSTARFNVANFDFPNLSLTSIPVKSIAAKYYFLGGEFNKALEYLEESDRVNPYLMFSESIRSEIYQYLDVKDSLIFYAEKAFTGIPDNDKHFFILAKAYAQNGRFEEIDSIFNVVEKRKNPRILNIYFSTLLTNESKISDYAKDVARRAGSEFPASEFPEIELTSKYVIFGTERINKAIDKDFAAQTEYRSQNYAEAAKLYAEASELNPTDYSLFENAGVSYYMNNEYDKSLEYLNVVIDSMNPGTGKSEFVAASVYIKKNNRPKICQYANLAAALDYPGSYAIISQFCNN